jgi:hypothetical protein
MGKAPKLLYEGIPLFIEGLLIYLEGDVESGLGFGEGF